jgi:hypothetical protein
MQGTQQAIIEGSGLFGGESSHPSQRPADFFGKIEKSIVFID